MPEQQHLSGEEAMSRVVEAVEGAADALDPVAAFFETLDRALMEHNETERASLGSFIRSYKKAAQQLEAESEDEPEQ